MNFPFKILKTIQAIGVLLRFDGVKRMNYMRLLKLLYIADRESLGETGRPITGGPVIAMERGPVLKEVYELILGQHREMPLWAQFFRKERYDLLELAEPDVGQLSRYEISKLQEVAKTYQEDDEWAIWSNITLHIGVTQWWSGVHIAPFGSDAHDSPHVRPQAQMPRPRLHRFPHRFP